MKVIRSNIGDDDFDSTVNSIGLMEMSLISSWNNISDKVNLEYIFFLKKIVKDIETTACGLIVSAMESDERKMNEMLDILKVQFKNSTEKFMSLVGELQEATLNEKNKP